MAGTIRRSRSTPMRYSRAKPYPPLAGSHPLEGFACGRRNSRTHMNRYVYTRGKRCIGSTLSKKNNPERARFGPLEHDSMEAILEHLTMETANDMKCGGLQLEGVRVSMTKPNRDLWSILLDKREGEAWMMINSARDGEGPWAYVKLHQWFTKTTLQGQTSNRMRIMHPIAPKHDHEVAGADEKWEERYRMLLEEDGEDEIPEKYKMSALKQLPCGDVRKHMHLKDKELSTYAEMRAAIRTLAVNQG